ncbi:cAMP-dependent protein kinase inhibitor beta isoform X2 [Callithrix jacchus]
METVSLASPRLFTICETLPAKSPTRPSASRHFLPGMGWLRRESCVQVTHARPQSARLSFFQENFPRTAGWKLMANVETVVGQIKKTVLTKDPISGEDEDGGMESRAILKRHPIKRTLGEARNPVPGTEKKNTCATGYHGCALQYPSESGEQKQQRLRKQQQRPERKSDSYLQRTNLVNRKFI